MHKAAFIFVVATFLCCPAGALAQPAPKHLDFEEDNIGRVPEGWRVTSHGYTARVKRGKAKNGRRYVRLSSKDGAKRSRFGKLVQSLDADQYQGRVVRFRAAVRAKVYGENTARLRLRVYRPDKRKGFFDKMADRPITSDKWAYYEIVGDVAEDAERIEFGLMLNKEGHACLDDVTIEVLGSDDDASYWNARGLAHGRKGKHKRAIAAFTNAITIKPDFAEALMNRSNAHTERGDTDQASADYRQAVALVPDLAKSLPQNGWVERYRTGDAIAPLKIRARPGPEQHHYIKLVDWDNKEKTVLTVFVRESHWVDIKVPLGSYELRWAAGETWYGPTLLFGETTRYGRSGYRQVFKRTKKGTQGHELLLSPTAAEWEDIRKYRGGRGSTGQISADEF
jgi:tetratricopeptide (TPR) repeat protein